MKKGINLNCMRDRVTIEEQFVLMKANGFSTTFCMADADGVDAIIEKGQASGISFETLHAPLNMINDIWRTDERADMMLQKLLASVETCDRHGIPILVVHLSAGRPAPLMHDMGCHKYDVLMEKADKHNVKIAYENSRCVANLAMALEKYENAGFCWDIGHENCFTPGMMFMPYFNDKLITVHLHDNMLNLDEDLHMLPYDGKIDMEHIAKELAGAKYQGPVMLEVYTHADIYKEITPEEFYKKAGNAAEKLKKAIEKNALI